MLCAIVDERTHAHAEQEHENVSEGNRDRVANEQVDRTFLFGEGLELFRCNDRVGSNATGVEFTVVCVVVVVAPFPDAGRCQNVEPKKRHERIGDLRFLQDGLVLMIVIDDEHPRDRQSCKYARDRF